MPASAAFNASPRTRARGPDPRFARIADVCTPGSRVLLMGATKAVHPLTTVLRGCAVDRLDPSEERAPTDAYDVVILRTGRPAALRTARRMLAPEGVVCLLAPADPRFDDAKTLFLEREHIGCIAKDARDAGDEHLWVGALTPAAEPATAGNAGLPLVISFYTRDTPYEAEAQHLIASCRELGLDFDVRAVKPRGSWEANCAVKASFVRDLWRECGRPVMWVDADAVVRRAPRLLAGAVADFAIHKRDGWRFASGTLFFNQTEGAGDLLDRWAHRCERDPTTWDQVSLDLAWEEAVTRSPLHTLWLPEWYTKVFDRETDAGVGAEPVVEHYQGSRRHKEAVGEAEPAPPPPAMPGVRSARGASRPRAGLVEPRGAAVVDSPDRREVETLRRRLVSRTADLAKAMGARTIALYGAGSLASAIVHEPWASRGVRVAAVLDDNPKKAELLGVPVVAPDELGEAVDTVVLCSEAHEEALAVRAEMHFGPRHIPILRIFGPETDAVVSEGDRARRALEFARSKCGGAEPAVWRPGDVAPEGAPAIVALGAIDRTGDPERTLDILAGAAAPGGIVVFDAPNALRHAASDAPGALHADTLLALASARFASVELFGQRAADSPSAPPLPPGVFPLAGAHASLAERLIAVCRSSGGR